MEKVTTELDIMKEIKIARTEDKDVLDTIKSEFKKDRTKNDKTHVDLYTLENYCERY
jgi:hypothetical protein